MTMYLNQTSDQSKNNQRHPQGSVLILVVAVLVMLVLIGTVLLQTARNDRFATAQLNNNHIDEVGMASMDSIKQVLKEDILRGGVALNGQGDKDNEPNEPYDYPHEDVDPWLSWTSPDYSTGTGEWPHITDLFKKFTGNTKLAVNLFNPDTAGTGFGSLADTDGDGFIDARYAVAPISNIKGVKYYVAMRIIDNASMINMNVATAVSDVNGKLVDAQAPRCWYPTAWDLSAFARRAELFGVTGLLSTTDPSKEPDIKKLLQYRLGLPTNTTAKLPTPWDNSVESRFTFWKHGPRHYNNYNISDTSKKYQMLTLGEEFELRKNNGLNSSDSYTFINQLLPNLTRETGKSSDTNEQSITDISITNYQTEKIFFDAEPRRLMTFHSGTGLFRPALEGETGINLKKNINKLTTIELATEIYLVLRAGADDPDNPKIEEVKRVLSPGWKKIYENMAGFGGEPKEFLMNYCRLYAACIQDYADADNIPTEVDWLPASTARKMYGFEAFPTITEAFVQFDYQITQSTLNPLGTPPATETWDVLCERKGSGFILELRNPHPFEISLENIWIQINGVTEKLTDLGTGTTLEKDQYLVIYRNTGSGDSDKEDVLKATGIDGATAKKGEWPDPSPFKDEEGDIEVKLFASKADKSILDFPYQTVLVQVIENDGSGDDGKYTDPKYANTPASEDPKDKWLYKYSSTIGVGRGINLLLVKSDEFEKDKFNVSASTDFPGAYGSPQSTLGEIKKNPDLLCKHDRNQIAMLNSGQLHQIGDLAQIATFGWVPDPANPPQHFTLRDLWDKSEIKDELTRPPADDPLWNKVAVEQLMLDFRTLTTINPDYAGMGDDILVGVDKEHLKVPHAVLLMDRLTTYDVQTNNRDDDGDGETDEQDEILVVGRININTVPYSLLRTILPFDSSNGASPLRPITMSQELANVIVGYRDKKGPFVNNGHGWGDNYRDTPGIAYIGELMNCISTNVMEGRMDALATDRRDSLKAGKITADFVPGSLINDGIKDDREEKTMLFRHLSQICTTRSDIFTAYIQVRGERDGRLVEQRRYIAVFDRSGLADSTNGQVRLIGLMKN